MREAKEDFISYLKKIEPEGVYNPYKDKGYSLRIMDTLEELPTNRYIQGTHIILNNEKVEIRYRRWSLVTATDLTIFFLGQGGEHHILNERDPEEIIFKFLENQENPAITLNWEDSQEYSPWICYLIYPVFSLAPDDSYYERSLKLTKEEGEILFL